MTQAWYKPNSYSGWSSVLSSSNLALSLNRFLFILIPRIALLILFSAHLSIHCPWRFKTLFCWAHQISFSPIARTTLECKINYCNYKHFNNRLRVDVRQRTRTFYPFLKSENFKKKNEAKTTIFGAQKTSACGWQGGGGHGKKDLYLAGNWRPLCTLLLLARAHFSRSFALKSFLFL